MFQGGKWWSSLNVNSFNDSNILEMNLLMKANYIVLRIHAVQEALQMWILQEKGLEGAGLEA